MDAARRKHRFSIAALAAHRAAENQLKSKGTTTFSEDIKMTDDLNLVPDEFEVNNPAEALDMIELTMDKFLDTGSVVMVYGDPIKHGDNLIIPCSESFTLLGLGAGYGYGKSPAEEDQEGKENQGENVGGGGGGGGYGRSFARPVAIVVASPNGVRVEPVVDATKIALAALTASGFMIGMIGRMLSPKKAFKSIKGQ
jgi:uncharacterized spore protein YtfJ